MATEDIILVISGALELVTVAAVELFRSRRRMVLKGREVAAVVVCGFFGSSLFVTYLGFKIEGPHWHLVLPVLAAAIVGTHILVVCRGVGVITQDIDGVADLIAKLLLENVSPEQVQRVHLRKNRLLCLIVATGPKEALCAISTHITKYSPCTQLPCRWHVLAFCIEMLLLGSVVTTFWYRF